MFCPKCGFQNEDSAHFCRQCGEGLNIHANMKNYRSTPQTYQKQSSNNKVIIIALSLIIIIAIVAGVFLYVSTNNAMQQDGASNNAVNSPQEVTAQASQNENSPLKIIRGSFSTASSLPAKTYISIYVGKEHAGENAKLSVAFSYQGTPLNPGNIVSQSVDSSGYISIRTANELSNYPDYAYISLYDSNGNLMDTKEVYMSSSSGKQTF